MYIPNSSDLQTSPLRMGLGDTDTNSVDNTTNSPENENDSTVVSLSIFYSNNGWHSMTYHQTISTYDDSEIGSVNEDIDNLMDALTIDAPGHAEIDVQPAWTGVIQT